MWLDWLVFCDYVLCVCPLMPSHNTYLLTWVSLTLDAGYLFTAAPAKCNRCPYFGRGESPYRRPSWPWTWSASSRPSWNHNHRKLVNLITRTTAWSNSMKLSHAYGATQDGRVMVERSDRMWSTGEGNGKPLQYSCLENPMNSVNRTVWKQPYTSSNTGFGNPCK